MIRNDFDIVHSINEIRNISYKKISTELTHELWYNTYVRTHTLFIDSIYDIGIRIKTELDNLE